MRECVGVTSRQIIALSSFLTLVDWLVLARDRMARSNMTLQELVRADIQAFKHRIILITIMAISGARLLGVLISGVENTQIWSLPCRFCSNVDGQAVFAEVAEVGVQASAFLQHSHEYCRAGFDAKKT